MPETILLDTARGKVEILFEVVSAEHVQINAPMPPVGPGFFLVFAIGEQAEAIEAAKKIIEAEPLPENINITDRVPGAGRRSGGHSGPSCCALWQPVCISQAHHGEERPGLT